MEQQKNKYTNSRYFSTVYFYFQHLALGGNLAGIFFFWFFFFLTQASLGLLLVYIGLSSGEGSLYVSIFMEGIILLSLLEGGDGRKKHRET